MKKRGVPVEAAAAGAHLASARTRRRQKSRKNRAGNFLALARSWETFPRQMYTTLVCVCGCARACVCVGVHVYICTSTGLLCLSPGGLRYQGPPSRIPLSGLVFTGAIRFFMRVRAHALQRRSGDFIIASAAAAAAAGTALWEMAPFKGQGGLRMQN